MLCYNMTGNILKHFKTYELFTEDGMGWGANMEKYSDEQLFCLKNTDATIRLQGLVYN